MGFVGVAGIFRCAWVTRALIPEAECLGLILWLMLAAGTLTLGLRILERNLYVRFIYPTVCPSIASKGRTGKK